MMRVNKTGIFPSANRVLIKPDPIEDEVTSAGIVLPDSVKQSYEQGQATGTLVAIGPDAFCHIIERRYIVHGNGERELVEEVVKGYREPFANVGDRIAFAKYSGRPFKGTDGERYILTNDEDITGRVSEDVELTDLDTRKGSRANKGLSSGRD